MAGIKGNTFWTDVNLEPKRKYKFYVDLSPLTPAGQTPSLEFWMVKSITKPSFTVGETPHKVLNHTFYYPGKVEWNSVEAVLVDPGGQFDSSKSLMRKLERGGYRTPTSGQTFMLTKKALSNDIKIYQFLQHYEDATGAELQGSAPASQQLLESWTLKNAWIQDVKFGDLAYDSEDMVDVTVNFRYDWAEIVHYADNVDVTGL